MKYVTIELPKMKIKHRIRKQTKIPFPDLDDKETPLVYLYGARRNPEVNNEHFKSNKLFDLYKLDRKGNRKYFITFSDIEKVGINPVNIYATPIGVYTYPLRDIIEEIEYDSIPFASNRPFIHVLQINTKNILNFKSYDVSAYHNDMNKLRLIYEKNHNIIQKKLDIDIYQDTIEKFMRVLYDRVNSKSDFRLNTFEYLCDTAIPIAKRLAKLAEKKVSHKHYFWITTLLLSLLLMKGKFIVDKNNYLHTSTWNRILHTIGYDVIIDPGYGIIHPHEKTQAVFLDNKSYKHLMTLENTLSNNINIDGNFYDANHIPDNLVCKNLSLDSVSKIDKLPKNLVVKDNLRIAGFKFQGIGNPSNRYLYNLDNLTTNKLSITDTFISKLGNNIKYNEIYLRHTNVVEWNNKLELIQNVKNYKSDELDLSSFKNIKLPDGLEVNNLNLRRTKNVVFGKNTKVKSLMISDSEISELPDDIEILEKLYLSKSKLDKLPRFESLKTLNMSETKIKELPFNFEITDWLDISHCIIDKLAPNIKCNDIVNKNSNVVLVDNKLRLINELDNYTYEGNLSLFKINKLGNNLTVNGNLSLLGSFLKYLPKGLTVNGDLNLSLSYIKELPNDLKVSGKINISGCDFDKVPEYGKYNITIRGIYKSNLLEIDGKYIRVQDLKEYDGDLSLSYCFLTSLPKEFKVNGNLDLTNSRIKELPDGLKVNGELNLTKCKLDKIGRNIKYNSVVLNESNVIEKNGKLIIKE